VKREYLFLLWKLFCFLKKKGWAPERKILQQLSAFWLLLLLGWRAAVKKREAAGEDRPDQQPTSFFSKIRKRKKGKKREKSKTKQTKSKQTVLQQ
jgi:hypothetical protein